MTESESKERKFIRSLKDFLIKEEKEEMAYYWKAPDGDGYIQFGRADLAKDLIEEIKKEFPEL